MMVTLEEEQRDDSFPRKLARFLAIGFAVILVVFGFAVATGGAVVLFEKGELTARVLGALGLGLALFSAGAFSLFRLNPLSFLNEPVSESVRKTRRSVAWSMLLGAALGIALVVSDSDLNAFSNGPIDRNVAIAVSLAYVVFTPIFALYWHRNADEYERAAYADGALVAIYAYSLITPGWWMLTRAGLVPPQDPMIVFLIVIAIWGIGWLMKKSD
ncbi:MAG: hypothetical protein R3E14_14490 [Erythrobacter sp.]